MEENKLYIKVGTSVNKKTLETINNCVIGYFICFSKKPYKSIGCNFNENKDFENAIIIDKNNLDKIKVNKSLYLNNQIINF